MKHLLKNGQTIPTDKDLDERQLGFCQSNRSLYTKLNGQIVRVSGVNRELILTGEKWLFNGAPSDLPKVGLLGDEDTDVKDEIVLTGLNGCHPVFSVGANLNEKAHIHTEGTRTDAFSHTLVVCEDAIIDVEVIVIQSEGTVIVTIERNAAGQVNKLGSLTVNF